MPFVPESMLPARCGAKSYGSIADAADPGPAVAEDKGSILLQGWFYLGVAGLLGTLAGWAICEPWFVDDRGVHPGNVMLLPVIIMLMCVGFGISESLVERSLQKALMRGLMSLPLGFGLGFIFNWTEGFINSMRARSSTEWAW